MFRSYSQNSEDVLLNRCFANVAAGFYVDVGANSPVVDSVTIAFYQRGWRGVNIEPLPGRFRELQRYRPHDVNLQVICGEEVSDRVLYATPGLDGLSSLSYSLAAEAVGESAVVALSVSGTTLAMIFAEYLPHTIHFLKVDVEGAEREVLAGNDWDRWRPSIVIVESTVPRSQRRSNEAWRGILEARGYRRAYFDGLNDFYLSAESLELLEHFSIPVNFFDDVQPFSRFGNVFDDQRHPDFGWARALSARFLAAGAVLGPSTDFKVLTADLPEERLSQPPTAGDVRTAMYRALYRCPEATELADWDKRGASGETLGDLYRLLVNCDEFLTRRARAVTAV